MSGEKPSKGVIAAAAIIITLGGGVVLFALLWGAYQLGRVIWG